MLSRLMVARYFSLAVFGICAAGVIAVIALAYLMYSVGSEGDAVAIIGFFLNTAWIVIALIASTWLFAVRWRSVATSPLFAAVSFGFATCPLSFALNEWTFSPAALSATLQSQLQTSTALAIVLGTVINTAFFSLIGWLLYTSSKRVRLVANLTLVGLIVLALLSPFAVMRLVTSLPGIARAVSWRATGAVPRTVALIPINYLTGPKNSTLYPDALTIGSDSTVFVATFWTNSLVLYPTGSVQGKVAASISRRRLTGGGTESTSVAVSRQGIIYVLDRSTPSVLQFVRGREGGLKLVRHVDIGSVCKRPIGLAVDSHGHIYVLDASGQIEVLFQRRNGDAIFNQIYSSELRGAPNERYYFTGPVVDNLGNVYVAAGNLHVGGGMSTVIYVFSSSSRGIVHPTRAIQGFLTGLDGPEKFIDALATDQFNNVYVLTTRPPRVLEFSSSAQGNIAPLGIFSFPSGTNFDNPCCLAIAPNGQFYLGDRIGRSITIYATAKRTET